MQCLQYRCGDAFLLLLLHHWHHNYCQYYTIATMWLCNIWSYQSQCHVIRPWTSKFLVCVHHPQVSTTLPPPQLLFPQKIVQHTKHFTPMHPHHQINKHILHLPSNTVCYHQWAGYDVAIWHRAQRSLHALRWLMCWHSYKNTDMRAWK